MVEPEQLQIFEVSLNEAIENGFLVPYEYYGLKDNIDYNQIRYNGQKYNVQDLDRVLIINKRNEEILKEYLEKGHGNKAIGFCCSINHANRMADFFNQHGIPSVVITSVTVDRDTKIQQFRDNLFNVAFTVDIFNEGIDFPNVRVLLFLRPTESKTVFIQQLGRGLRLSSGKDKAIVIDFIGNYKKANIVRKLLSKNQKPQFNPHTGRVEKIIYEYTPGCKVQFESEVEEILDTQDTSEREISREDLIGAYFDLKEELKRKPTQEDINQNGEFKIARYLATFGTWVNFLQIIGEYTEASYHYPQGVHLGHVLYILKIVGDGNRKGTHLDDKYIRLRGQLNDGRVGAFQRQTKYKLQAMMELGLIFDDRDLKNIEEYQLKLTHLGSELHLLITKINPIINYSLKPEKDGVPSWAMAERPKYFNSIIRTIARENPRFKSIIFKIFLQVPAVSQMLNYIYRDERTKNISKNDIYTRFFKTPAVVRYCDQEGIDTATETGAEHRCPFLINILEAMDIIDQHTDSIEVKKFLICQSTMRFNSTESEDIIRERITQLKAILNHESKTLNPYDESIMKENFGKMFLSDEYHLREFEIIME